MDGAGQVSGGGGGIRTHGTLACTTVFETAPFDHSGTPPRLSSETRDYINYRLRGSKPGDGPGDGSAGGANRQKSWKTAA